MTSPNVDEARTEDDAERGWLAALEPIVLGERQRSILAVLGAAHAPLSFAQVHRRLPDGVTIKPSTTSTLLMRLTAQGFLQRSGKPFFYRYTLRPFTDEELIALLPRRYADYLDVLWRRGSVPYTVVQDELAARGAALEPTTVTSTLGRLHRHGLVIHNPVAHTYAAALGRAELLRALHAIVGGRGGSPEKRPQASSASPSVLEVLHSRVELSRELEAARESYDAAHLQFRACPDARALQVTQSAMQRLVTAERGWQALRDADASRDWQLITALGARRVSIHGPAGPVGELVPELIEPVAHALIICSGLEAEQLQEAFDSMEADTEQPTAAAENLGLPWQIQQASRTHWSLLASAGGRERLVGIFEAPEVAQRVLAVVAVVTHLDSAGRTARPAADSRQGGHAQA